MAVGTEADTRERLVAAAAELFWGRGYEATALADVLAEAGANGGSLYHYFGTKENLLLAVLDRRMEQLETEIFEPVRRLHDDPVERVFGVLEFYRRFLEECGLARGCPIGNLALELGDTHPRVRERLARLFDAWADGIREFLVEAEGLPDDSDPESLSRFVLTVMEGGVMQARTARSLEPFDASVRHLRTYLDGLLEDGGAASP